MKEEEPAEIHHDKRESGSEGAPVGLTPGIPWPAMSGLLQAH